MKFSCQTKSSSFTLGALDHAYLRRDGSLKESVVCNIVPRYYSDHSVVNVFFPGHRP